MRDAERDLCTTFRLECPDDVPLCLYCLLMAPQATMQQPVRDADITEVNDGPVG